MSASTTNPLTRGFDNLKKINPWVTLIGSLKRYFRKKDPTLLCYSLTFLRWLQDRVVPWELRLQPIWAWFLKFRGISFYVLPCSESGFKNADAFFAEAKRILTDADEIMLAGGEMAHALLEDERFKSVLLHAVEKNGVIISIVHGPRVDPETRTIFDLARKNTDRVRIYAMDEYKTHHFFLATTDGRISMIDEGTHDETLWGKSIVGDTPFGCKVQSFYVAEKSTRRGQDLRKEFDNRKQIADRIFMHPGLYSPQEYSSFKIVSDKLKIPFRRTLQFVAVLSDFPLDIHTWRNGKLNDTSTGKGANGENDMARQDEYFDRRRPEYLDLPEWMKGRPVKDITLTIRINGIPEGPACYACGLQTSKATVLYLYGDKLLVRADGPGYRCQHDGLEYLSKETLAEFEARAQEILSAGETRTS